MFYHSVLFVSTPKSRSLFLLQSTVVLKEEEVKYFPNLIVASGLHIHTKIVRTTIFFLNAEAYDKHNSLIILKLFT